MSIPGERGAPPGAAHGRDEDRLRARGVHDLGRRRARRYAPADPADVRGAGADRPAAIAEEHPALFPARRRPPAPDPADDLRGRAQPGGGRDGPRDGEAGRGDARRAGAGPGPGRGAGAAGRRGDRARPPHTEDRDRPLRRLREHLPRPRPRRCGSRSSAPEPTGMADAAGSLHAEVAGGGRLGPANRRREPQHRGRSRPPPGRADRPGGGDGHAGAAEARRRRHLDPRAGRRGGAGAPQAERRRRARGASLQRPGQDAAAGREGDGRARRRVHLDRAHPPGAQRPLLGRCRDPSRPRLADQGDLRGPRPAPGDLAEPRGDGAGVGEVRA